MPLVTSMDGQTLDDVYTIETSSPANIQGVSTGIVKMVGTFTKGIPGAVYTFDDYASATRLLGPSTLAVEGPLNIQALIKQKCGGFYVAPVFGTGAASAKITLQDSLETPGHVLTLTAAQAHPQTGIMTAILGTDANSMIATVANAVDSKFDLSIQYGTTVENYSGLTVANMVATINAKSSIVIASLPETPSSLLPEAGTFSFTGGANGIAADADFVGTIDASGNRTGMKVLEPITGNVVFVANQSSTTINAEVAAHGNNFDCIGLSCAPVSSTVAATIAANVSKQDNIGFCDGWRTMYDSDTKTNRAIAPMALVAGMASQKKTFKSWGNKSIAGTIAAITPRSIPELKALQAAGILCVTDNIPRGGVGTRNGVAADGSDLVTRQMRYFLELSIQGSMGWAVDEMQSTDTNDPLRGQIKKSIDAFLEPLKDPLDPTNRAIDSYLSVCDKSINSDGQIELGKLNVTVKVKLLGIAKQIIITADISESTITTTSQAA